MTSVVVCSHFDKARDAAEAEANALGIDFIRFQFRDLRAKAARDIESMSDARKLLGHTTENVTRNYVRTRIGERVFPIMAKLKNRDWLEIRVDIGGGGRNRTGVDGFAGRCMTTLPPRQKGCL
jgi:hypothetical protein